MRWILPVAILSFLAACHEPPHAPDRWTHVIGLETSYYTDGPQQARPPDGSLKRGLRVRVVEDAGSYVRIVTEDGRQGYVSRDAVDPVR